MLLRTIHKGLCQITGQNLCLGLPVNPTNTPLQLIWKQGFRPSLGVKSSVLATSVHPLDLECVVQLKILALTVGRNGIKKACDPARYRKISQVQCGQKLARSGNQRNTNSKNSLNVFQKLFKCNLRGSKNLSRIALGSALFVPMTFLKHNEVKSDEKILPIEIPSETKKSKKKEPLLLRLLANIYDYIQLCLRALRLFVTFVPILTIYPVTYLGERPSEWWWKLLVRAIEFSGPILIKLGQWASTRRDLFSDNCCCHFSRLQRRIQPHSWSFTAYRMRKAFGPNWRKVFVKFDNGQNPVGSGCVAQVYKVWMTTDAVTDEELLEEILSDMDDESGSAFEGLEILGFKKLFGFGDREHEAQENAINEWRRERDLQRLNDKESERRKQELLAKESEVFQPREFEKDENGEEETTDAGTDVIEHSLVEVWGETDLDKSLPIEEAPPEDLDGLIPVAVKVLHPAMHSCFRRDLIILRACASFITYVYPPLRWLSLPQCVDEFSIFMSGQINLKKEAENLELFSENFADVPSVKFPRPLRPYVTSRVMVETYEEGEGIGDFIGSSGEDKPDDLKHHLAQIGVDALLKMVFLDNLIHGDLHPGNMLIQNISMNENSTNASTAGDIARIMMVDVGYDTFVMDVQPDPNPLRICILDCGVVARLKERDLTNFKAVFKQIVLGDGGSVADLFLENSEHNCKDPEAFKAEMTELVETARQDTISLAQVDVGVLLQQVLSILLRHQVRLESAFSSVVLAVFVLEGLGRTLDPNMDILERARPLLVTGAIS